MAEQEDCARAEIKIPMSADAVFEFVSDIERLMRLNPHLAIETWQRLPGGIHFSALNEATGRRMDTVVSIDIVPASRSVVLGYAQGLKRATKLVVDDESDHSSRLVISEHYPVIGDASDPRVADVDRSLIPWANAIHCHLSGRRRWGWLPGWRWWHECVLSGMAPRQRRIVNMIVWISVLEFLVFLCVVAIFWLERQRG